MEDKQIGRINHSEKARDFVNLKLNVVDARNEREDSLSMLK